MTAGGLAPAIVLVGCGNMGGALLAGWLDRGLAAGTILVIEPDAGLAEAARARGCAVGADRSALSPSRPPQVIVLAVKPQVVDRLIGDYADLVAAGAVLLSIAAGKTIARLTAGLRTAPDGGGLAVVRAMPNTPAAIRRGITVACANDDTRESQRALCEDLLAAVGSVLWVEDEALIDAVTAVSGSGPAYVFLFAECLGRAGVEAGLPEEMAHRLARETVAGAGELLARSTQPAATLRRNVTSPGGTTAAALAVLMAEEEGLQPLLNRAVTAAKQRSRELGS